VALSEAGQVMALSARGLTADGEPVEKAEFAFASSNEKLATVDATGKVTAVKPGAVTLKAEGSGKATEAKLTIKKK
jgi:uncharacterized protein YjdB